MDKDIKYIGRIVQNLRKERRMTGEELARRANLSQPKISRIETGVSANLKRSEIERILNILGAPSTIQQQVMSRLGLHSSKRKTRALFKDIRHMDYSAVELLERRSHRVSVYSTTGVPALLQTAEYRVELLRAKGFPEDEVQKYTKSAIRRQDVMWLAKCKYHFIIGCSVLYGVIGAMQVHLAQLDRLERVMYVPNIKLGIIPTEAGIVPVEHGPFALYDDHILRLAMPRYEIETRDESDIVLLSTVFEELSRLAYYGDDALQLIRGATNYFS